MKMKCDFNFHVQVMRQAVVIQSFEIHRVMTEQLFTTKCTKSNRNLSFGHDEGL